MKPRYDLKNPCDDELDGSICKRTKGHGGKHIDGVVSMTGPVSWTDAGKERVLREREEQKQK
jgi:hypothetical protein